MVSRAPAILGHVREGKLSVRQIADSVGTHVSYVWSVINEAKARGVLKNFEHNETPRQARVRVASEIAEGKRCRRCWLLLPCDHGD